VIGFEVEFGNIAGFFRTKRGGRRSLVKPGSYVNDLTGSVVFSLPPGARAAACVPRWSAAASRRVTGL
jgi:hypothetical protein